MDLPLRLLVRSWRTDLPPGTPGSFVPDRGANALWDLCSLLFTGGLPPSVRAWFLGGRLLALAKPGDDGALPAAKRKLRPIAVGHGSTRPDRGTTIRQGAARLAELVAGEGRQTLRRVDLPSLALFDDPDGGGVGSDEGRNLAAVTRRAQT